MSSSLTNVVSTVFTARTGAALAQMRQYAGGMSNIGREMATTARHSGMMNNQMRALGTTLRYAFAGSVIFGVANMGKELQNIQGQLALMKAVGDVTDKTGKQIEITAGQLNKWQNEVLATGPKVLTTATDMNDAIVNFLSSVEGFDESKVVDVMALLSTGAGIAQTTVEELTTGVTSLNTAFGQANTLKNYTSIVESFVKIVQKVPGGRGYGRQFLLQLPQLSAQAKLVGATPEEMLASYMTGARVLPPAATGRGLQFAYLSLLKPGNKDAASALSQLGITPEFLTTQGPTAGFRKIISQMSPGTQSALAQYAAGPKPSEEEAEAEVDPEFVRGLGIEGRDMKLLSTLFTRVHGLRTFAAIAGQKGKSGRLGGQMEEDLSTIHDVYNRLGDESDTLRQDFKDFNESQPLKRLSVSLVNLRTQIEGDVAPALNFFANAISGWMSHVLGKDWTQYATGVGVLGLGAYGVKRMVKSGKGIPKAGGALLAASAIGEEGLGASPFNPMFVVVVGDITSLFGAGIFKKFGKLFGKGAGGAADDVAKAAGKSGWLRGSLGKAGRYGLKFAKVGGPLAAIGLIADAAINAEDAEAGGFATPELQRAAMANRRRGANLARANRIGLGGPGANIMQMYKKSDSTMFGKAMVQVDVLVKQPDGKKERKTYHVPVEFWNNGPTPGSRGQPGKTK